MMVEDRAGHGSAALRGGDRRADGARRQARPAWPRSSPCSRPRRRRSISTSTAPRRSCSASTCRTCSTRCRSSSARPTSTTSICSAAPSASPRRRATRTGSTSADVLKIRVRNSNGDTVPLGSFTTVTRHHRPVPRAALQSLSRRRDRRRRRARLFAGPGDRDHGQARGRDAAGRLRHRVDRRSPIQQIRAGNTAMFAFVLAVVFVFLVLAAQYESLTLPLAVIMIVPMCLVAAITGVILRGQDNNILTQVGFVVLIGLAAKNAILIVEFARQLEDQGRTRWEAAVEATRLRLRPILMTSFAFILGVTPLVWAIGAGAELRQALGTAVFFGMIGVTAFGLIFTPVFYVIARWIAQLVAARQAPQRGGSRTAAEPAECRRRRRLPACIGYSLRSAIRRKCWSRHAGAGVSRAAVQSAVPDNVIMPVLCGCCRPTFTAEGDHHMIRTVFAVPPRPPSRSASARRRPGGPDQGAQGADEGQWRSGQDRSPTWPRATRRSIRRRCTRYSRTFQDAAAKMPGLYPDNSKTAIRATTSTPAQKFGKTWPTSKRGSSSSARMPKRPTPASRTSTASRRRSATSARTIAAAATRSIALKKS